MDTIVAIVKFIVIFQLVIITGFIVLTFFMRLYLKHYTEKKSKKIQQIRVIMDSILERKTGLLPADAALLKKNPQLVLVVLAEIEKIHINFESFAALKLQLSESVLKPTARTLASSRSWYKRYFAARLFNYGFDRIDESKILKLLDDSTTLISINAAISVVKYDNLELINEMITIFSKRRRLQQTVYAEMIGATNQDISEIIINRMQKEQDPYVKLFCYRLLQVMPPQPAIISSAKEDIMLDSIDLKIAVLHYVVRSEDRAKEHIIYQLADDPSWEVRGAAAKALSCISSERSTLLLSNLLCDSQWWVRINAAHALIEHGPSGINVLEQLSIDEDKFAYQTAQEALLARRNQ